MKKIRIFWVLTLTRILAIEDWGYEISLNSVIKDLRIFYFWFSHQKKINGQPMILGMSIFKVLCSTLFHKSEAGLSNIVTNSTLINSTRNKSSKFLNIHQILVFRMILILFLDWNFSWIFVINFLIFHLYIINNINI